MKTRMLAVLLALPLLAFDCGGEEKPDLNPFGLGCTLHVGGAVSEDLWCIVAAHDYSQDPVPQNQWVFLLTAYRGTTEVGGGAGMFLGGRPALNTSYGWSGGTRSTLLTDGSAQRYASFVETHSAVSLAGTGSLHVSFREIPPVGATGEQTIGVHGTLSGTLPSDTTGGPVTFSATF